MGSRQCLDQRSRNDSDHMKFSNPEIRVALALLSVKRRYDLTTRGGRRSCLMGCVSTIPYFDGPSKFFDVEILAHIQPEKKLSQLVNLKDTRNGFPIGVHRVIYVECKASNMLDLNP
ncbi:hypothetical protein RSAG8_08329, partial [Rhizoctonia solani AG-8 WAC10335]